MLTILLTLIVLSSVGCVRYHPAVSSASSDCFPILNEPYTITCREIPDLSLEANYKFFANYKKIVFDLENKNSLSSRSFYNLSFSWSNRIDILFKNINKLSSFSFDSVKLEENVILNIELDGSGLNLDKQKTDSRLLINENAFYNIIIGKKSQLKIQIRDYKSLLIKDNLVQNLAWQNELSEIGVSLLNIEKIEYKNRNGKNYDDDLKDYDQDELESSNDLPILLNKNQIHTLKNNLTYTLQITDCRSLIFEPQIFSGVLINSFSDFNILLKNIDSLFLSNNMFDSLMLGYYAKFNFIIENVQKVSLGKSMFNGLQTDQYSVFYFHCEKVNYSNNKTKRQAGEGTEEALFDDYGDYYDDYEQPSITIYNDWLSIPEGFFKNVRMSDSSIIQVHFTNIDMCMTFSPDSFKEIELSLDAKFQLMLQDVTGHVIISENAINLVKVMHGLFEFWIDNQKKIINNGRFLASKEQDLSSFKNPIKIFNNAANKYIRYMDNSINKIYLTSGSNFRFGFLNLNAIILMNSKSISDILIDRFDKSKSTLDYRTKFEFDITESDEFMMDFLSLNSIDSQDLTLPKLIEIDGYKPIVSLIKLDKTIETIYPEILKSDKNLKRKLFVQRSNSILSHEFCRFYKLRPFMVNLNTLKSNLVYFSQTSMSDYVSDSSLPSVKSCTSCLLIYLYRTIHRRQDFYFVKDHLPSCFINLHFGDDSKFELLISNNANLKANYINKIEDSFKSYWKMLNCKEVTGLSLVLNYDPETIPGDESNENYELISHKCVESERIDIDKEIKVIEKIDSSTWSEISNRIYLKNIIDSKSNKTDKVEIGLYKKKAVGKKSKNNLSTGSWILIITAIMSCFGLIYYYVTYNRPKKPCLRLNFYRGNKNFQRLEYNRNGQNSSMNNMEGDEEEPDNNGETNDELNGFEYDDEFEINENQNEENIDNESVDCVDIQVIDASNSSKLASLKTKSLNQIKRLKNNLLNRDVLKTGLLNVTNLNHAHFRKSDPNSKYPSYSYKSTESTLVQNQNDFELKEEDFKVNSLVTYDIKNKKSVPLVDRASDISEIVQEPVMRLSTNPLENLEAVENRIKNSQQVVLKEDKEEDGLESNA